MAKLNMTKLTMLEMERFWSKVVKTNYCWNWKVGCSQGYGMIKINKKQKYAHRISYEQKYGKIPEGLELDHLCRNRKCVNPDHLEAVTSRENTMRGKNITSENAKKTYCTHGHEFTKENTYVYESKEGKKRHCRTCRQIIASKSSQHKKMAVVTN